MKNSKIFNYDISSHDNFSHTIRFNSRIVWYIKNIICKMKLNNK